MYNKWGRCFILVLAVIMVCFNVPLANAQGTSKHLVVIDAAHGGDDTGVIGADKIAEKDLTLSLAKAVQKELAQDVGIEVRMTRDSDKTISIEDRKKKIAEWKPALVLNLHVNAGFGKNSSGYELYYPGFKETDTKNKGTSAAPDNKYVNDTVKFARLVERNLDQLFPRKGRGLREASTVLMDGLHVPVLAVEVGFVSNPDEKKKIGSDKTRADMARALAKSVKMFF